MVKCKDHVCILHASPGCYSDQNAHIVTNYSFSLRYSFPRTHISLTFPLSCIQNLVGSLSTIGPINKLCLPDMFSSHAYDNKQSCIVNTQVSIFIICPKVYSHFISIGGGTTGRISKKLCLFDTN
jgi:hypothetical protein